MTASDNALFYASHSDLLEGALQSLQSFEHCIRLKCNNKIAKERLITMLIRYKYYSRRHPHTSGDKKSRERKKRMSV